MWPFVIAWLALLCLSAVYVQLVLHHDVTALPALFAAQPAPQQLLIAAIVLIALYLMGAAIWQAARLGEVARDARVLRGRLRGVREAAATVDKSQASLTSAVDHLVASDPERTLESLHQKLSEAEARTAAQRGRNEAVDMTARLDEIRRRQQALREQLGEVSERRRAIAPLFDELRERQIQLDRGLTEMETQAGTDDLDRRVAVIGQHVGQLQARLGVLEAHFARLNGFRDEFADAQARLGPLRAPAGMRALLDELTIRGQEIARAIEALENEGDGQLFERVEALARARNDNEQRMARLFEASAVLEAIRTSVDELAVRQTRIDQMIAESETDASGRSLAERQAELAEAAAQSRARLLNLENTLALLNRFRDDLDRTHAELMPLQSPLGGIESALAALRDRNQKLAHALDELEADGSGEKLPARVEAVYRSKVETEQRLAEAAAHLARLEALRKDVDGLFARLGATLGRLG
jgi:chromosome segregation ATPase